MPDLLLSSVEYYGYISIFKFVTFLVLFFLWLPLVPWIYRDTQTAEVNQKMWTLVMLAVGAIGAIVWLLTPFIIGIIVYILAVGVTSLFYVSYRNARVMESERILTAEHIKSLFTPGDKRQATLEDIKFKTANRNTVPLPEPKTPDFFGYKAARDILTDAIWRRADTVAFSPTGSDYSVTYHVDGMQIKQPSLDKEQAGYFIQFIKSVADLNIKEKRKPQKGKFSVSQTNQDTSWEVVTAGSTVGEQVQLKLMSHNELKNLSDLGLGGKQLEELAGLNALKQGLFIVSGPAKSGVTTTFYTLLKNHDAFLNSIHTLEKKPSAVLPDITQEIFSLSETSTTSYADKLEGIIRMGPDILGIADCTDARSAELACKAALDGKMIYVLLEAETAVQAMGKWIKITGNAKLATEALVGISNQRLIRKLCEECKQGYTPNQDIVKKFNLPADKAKVLYKEGKVQFDKHGKPVTCDGCQGTGFVGRTGIFEIIRIDDNLKNAIRQSKSLSEISAHFRAARMLYLQEQALKKILGGSTSVKEMVRVLTPAQAPGPKVQKKPETS